MAEAMLSRIQKLPPHIHSADSLTKRFWGQGAALLPIFITACFTGHGEILRVLLISLVSAVAFEFLITKLSGKKENLRRGEALLAAAIFSLLVPSRCPSEIVILGIFITSGVREFFGGTGAYPLQPLLLAYAVLRTSFPEVISGPMFWSGEGNLGTLAATGLSCALLMNQKKGYWETPVLFATVCFACESLSPGNGTSLAFFGSVLFSAFFLLADPVVLPLTRKGSAVFVLGAAFLSAYLEPGGFSISAAIFAVLWMSLVTPWLDVWLRPVPFKNKHTLKATYPL